jgi:hypothetical protein
MLFQAKSEFALISFGISLPSKLLPSVIYLRRPVHRLHCRTPTISSCLMRFYSPEVRTPFGQKFPWPCCLPTAIFLEPQEILLSFPGCNTRQDGGRRTFQHENHFRPTMATATTGPRFHISHVESTTLLTHVSTTPHQILKTTSSPFLTDAPSRHQAGHAACFEGTCAPDGLVYITP